MGFDPATSELVIFRRHSTVEFPVCARAYHGYVVEYRNMLRVEQRNVAKDKGFPIPRKDFDPRRGL